MQNVPHSIEVLLKKAAVDAEFRRALLENRSAAAELIELEIDPAEASILDNIPREELEAIIARTKVNPKNRWIFLGVAGALMLAVVLSLKSCDEVENYLRYHVLRSLGMQPDIMQPDIVDIDEQEDDDY